MSRKWRGKKKKPGLSKEVDVLLQTIFLKLLQGIAMVAVGRPLVRIQSKHRRVLDRVKAFITLHGRNSVEEDFVRVRIMREKACFRFQPTLLWDIVAVNRTLRERYPKNFALPVLGGSAWLAHLDECEYCLYRIGMLPKDSPAKTEVMKLIEKLKLKLKSLSPDEVKANT